MPAPTPAALRKRAIAQAWRAGFLAWKLDSLQRRTHADIWRKMEKPFARYVLKWARRTGKTFLLVLIAFELAIRKRRARINIAASTKDSLREIIWPIVDLLLSDCPEEMRPRLREQRGRIEFPNGSIIVLGSCDSKRTVERLRGTKADLNILEEGGTIPDDPGLRYVMTSILNPQLLTTGGATLMALTPPKSPGHESVAITLQAKALGNYSEATLYENPRISTETREAYLRADAEALGMTVDEYKDSADYRREWLGEFLADPERAVLPGFTAEAEAAIVAPLESRVLFSDRYVSMDVGWSPDFTGVLFAFWDFERQRLVIEHELLMRRMNTVELATAIRDAEARLWGGHQPRLRVSDVAPILLHDLASMHGLTFVPTDKDDRDAAIAAADVWVRQRKVQIVPYDPATGLGCRFLPQQMRQATHNKHRTDFERTPEHGHFDLVASLVYLVRNVRKNMGRVPENWGIGPDTWVSPKAPPRTLSPNANNLRKLAGGR